MTNRPAIQIVSRCLLVLGISISLWLMLFSTVQAESIKSFKADIAVADNGTLLVTEDISYDFGDLEKHGIFREIKTKHAQPTTVWYQERQIDLRPLTVTRNGEPEPFENESSKGFYLRIGDAGRTISGEQQYQITYEVTGALSQLEDSVELYWNATGNQWVVPIEHSEVTVHLTGASTLGEQAACYVGQSGTAQRCQNIERLDSDNGESVIFSQQQELPPGSGLTIAQELQLTEPIEIIQHTNYLYPVLTLGLLWLLGLGRYLYLGKTRYKGRTTVIAQYEPYADFAPLFTGVLLDKRLDARDITAGIIHLAEQGFIAIVQKTEKTFFVFETQDYEIELLKDPATADSLYAADLLGLLFADSRASKPAAGNKVRLSGIKKNQAKLRKNAKVIQKLQTTVKARLVDLGFVEKNWDKKVRVAAVVYIVLAGLSFILVGGLPALIPLSVVLLLAVFIPVTLVLLLLVTLDRRTSKGYEAMYYLRGFKDFLSVTEKERYKFHNAPSKSPEQFMQFLPYAIAFGVEKEWSEVFSDIVIMTPDWYQSEVAGSQFSAAAFTSDLSSFSNSLTTSAGAGGGSGGSGVSGGGSGGGGGGSW